MCVHKCIHLKVCIPVCAGASECKYVYQYLDKSLFRSKCAFLCVDKHVGICPDLCMRLHGLTCQCGSVYRCAFRLGWTNHWMHVCSTQRL